MPSLPGEKSKSLDRELIDEIKLVADYAGLSIIEALELPCDLFALTLKKAFINKLNQSEEGREYLQTCQNINTTECDLDALINFYDEVDEE